VAYVLEPSAKDMERTVRLADAVRERHGRRRQPGSQFDDELAAANDTRAGQHLHDGVNLAGLRIIVASEHLESLTALVRSESTIYSVYTVARTAAEVGARAWWLFDPSIDGSDCVQRSLADELYSLDQRENLGGEFAENARARREELRRLADDENLHIKDRNQRLRGATRMHGQTQHPLHPRRERARPPSCSDPRRYLQLIVFTISASAAFTARG
jgi:hypothetical protein